MCTETSSSDNFLWGPWILAKWKSNQNPVSCPIYIESLLTGYQPRCQGHQVGTNACNPDPTLPQRLSFLTRLMGGHLLWTRSNESDQAVEYLCLVMPLQSEDLVVLLLCWLHCCWDQTTSQAVQESVLIYLTNILFQISVQGKIDFEWSRKRNQVINILFGFWGDFEPFGSFLLPFIKFQWFE